MIEINHLVKKYGSHVAVDDLSLTVEPGKIYGFLGPNGAGKSTLFNAITGAFFADKGLIMLDGEDITYQKEHVRSKVIGHLFQDPLKGTAPHMTIEENMALAYLRTTTSKNAYFSRIKAADKKKFREQLALLDMGLEDRMKQPVGLLSGGQRQRISLARAILKDAPIVVLDEATAYADPENEEKMEAAIAELVKGKTLVVIAHKLPAIMNADQICVVDHGKLSGGDALHLLFRLDDVFPSAERHEARLHKHRRVAVLEHDVDRLGLSLPRVSADEVHLVEVERLAILLVGVVSAADVDSVVSHVLLHHIPRASAQPQALALSDGVVMGAVVLADLLAVAYGVAPRAVRFLRTAALTYWSNAFFGFTGVCLTMVKLKIMPV